MCRTVRFCSVSHKTWQHNLPIRIGGVYVMRNRVMEDSMKSFHHPITHRMISEWPTFPNIQNLTRFLEKCRGEWPSLICDQSRSTSMPSYNLCSVESCTSFRWNVRYREGFDVLWEMIGEGQKISVFPGCYNIRPGNVEWCNLVRFRRGFYLS